MLDPLHVQFVHVNKMLLMMMMITGTETFRLSNTFLSPLSFSEFLKMMENVQ